MKINIVVPSTVLGGGVRVIFLYSNYLVSRGHDVVVYVPMLAYSDKRGVPNIKTSIANTFKRGTKVKWFDCEFKIKLAFAIKDSFIRDADITIASAWFTAPDVYELGFKKGKKVYFIQGHELNRDRTNADIVESTYNLDMNRIVITNHMKNFIKEKYNKDSMLIFNGVSSDEYITKKKIINKKKCIIMLGNTAPYKGGKKGIEILENLYHKYKIRIILYGTSKMEGLPNYFEFYQQPTRKELVELYQQADICLFPSINEGWGLIVTEAMANKCAVVGHNTGCLKELCEDNKDALITKNFDFNELERRVEQLINDENLLKKIQNNSYELAKTLKWENSYKKFENYLESIILNKF